MTTAAGSTATPTSPLAGAGLLLRALLRHDGHRFAPWVVVATALSALTLLGPTFRLPDPYLALSPFWHVPAVPGGDGGAGGLAGVCLAAVLLTTVGFVGFSRRDLATG